MPHETEHVACEICSGCGGVWFRQGQFSRLIHEHELGEVVEQDHALGANAHTHDPGKCPSCRERLRPAKHGATTDVLLHRCIGCGGTFVPFEQLHPLAEYEESRLGDSAARKAKLAKLPPEMREAIGTIGATSATGALRSERILDRLTFCNQVLGEWGARL